MDLNKKINEQIDNVKTINKQIDLMLSEQPVSGQTTDIPKSIEKPIRDMMALANQLSDNPVDSSETTETESGVITLRHNEIEFDDDDDSKISSKQSSSYKVSSIENKGSKTILTLDGKQNALIPDDLILYITIPYSEGVNYRDDFDAELKQKNRLTNDEEDLDDVNMRIIRFVKK
jgi:hypothetical protein